MKTSNTSTTVCQLLSRPKISLTYLLYSRASVLDIGVVSPAQVHLDHPDCQAETSREKFSLSTGFMECGTNITFTADQSMCTDMFITIVVDLHSFVKLYN